MTLVEVVAALALLGIGLAGSYYAIGAAMQARRFAHERYTATLIANNQVERAKNLPFVQLVLLSSDNNTRVDELGQVSLSGRFHRTTSVTTPWDGNTNIAYVSVSVLVPHPRLQGGSGTSTVATLLRRMD